MSKTETSRRLHRIAFQGGALRGGIQAPFGWGAENAGAIGGCSVGKGGASFPPKRKSLAVQVEEKNLYQ